MVVSVADPMTVNIEGIQKEADFQSMTLLLQTLNYTS